MSKSQMKTMLIIVFDIKGNVDFEFIPQDQNSQPSLLCGNNGYMKLCVEKGLNFGLRTGLSTITMLQLTRHSLSSSFWPKN